MRSKVLILVIGAGFVTLPILIHAGSSPHLPSLDLGDKVPADATEKEGYVILVSPAQFQPMWIWKHEDVEYELGVDDDGFVQFISTSSNHVATPEGVRVGQPFAELGSIAGVTIREWPGWGRVAKFPSGWSAMCDLRYPLPGGGEPPCDKVDMLFKGTLAGYGQRETILKRYLGCGK